MGDPVDWTARARVVEQALDLADAKDAEDSRVEMLAALDAEAYLAGQIQGEADTVVGAYKHGFDEGHAAGVAEERARIAAWLEAAPGVDGIFCKGPQDHDGHPNGVYWSPECIAAALRAGRGKVRG